MYSSNDLLLSFFKDCHKIVFWEKHDCLLGTAVRLQTQHGQNKRMKSVMSQISHTNKTQFDVRYKAATHAFRLRYLVLTWLQMDFLPGTLHVMGCRVSSSHAATFAWSHVMLSADMRQNHSVRRPGPFFLGQSSTVVFLIRVQHRSAIGCEMEECDLLSLDNVPSTHRADLNGAFVLVFVSSWTVAHHCRF